MSVSLMAGCALLCAGVVAGHVQPAESDVRPEAGLQDLQILDMADGILLNESHWLPSGDRDCELDAPSHNLFCALAYANAYTLGEYQHRAAAMQAVRFAIEEQVDTSGYQHRLMDYNNADGRQFSEIKDVIRMARYDITEQLLENGILTKAQAEFILNTHDPAASAD
ncbi:DUF6197 family protein [Parvularcula marina]|uniref:Uncharacterized protein n=1 Tax=Parvularcula marina TaxID=2292771 RepID=A0A371RGY5_9PROT|nr:hypothetical protein [Parvularcula marina]RFB04692.1 hypothetical protein DX908_05010 [Parvularcula marina]